MGDETKDLQPTATLTRREVMQRVSALLGGVALSGGDGLLAFSFDDAALTQALGQGTRVFSVADVALLDEIAETILPATKSPGAKAAKTGAFMALMVNDAYTDRNRVNFMRATPAQRLALLETLDREQKAVMDARLPAPSNRAPAPESQNDEPPHYFRMMKELALLGFFTSEVGCTQALRYIEAPGKYDPCAPHAPGDRSWAAHA
jgi:hypothetical protein